VFESRLNRRRMLSLAGSASLAAVAGCRATPEQDRARPVSLHFLDTPFDAENTHSLLTDFTKRNPSAPVERQEVPANRLLTNLAASLASGTALDLALVPAGSLAPLAAAGSLLDLGKLNGARLLDRVELPWVREQTVVNGSRFGAPAWVRLRGFFYNRTYLQSTNQAPPSSFDELKAAGEFLRSQRLVNYAFYWPLKTGPGIFPDDYLADGSRFFDALLSPRFDNDARYADVLDWRTRAIWDWSLVDPRGLSNEQDTDNSFPHGWAAFTWGTYDQLRHWQTSGYFLQSGHLANGLVPSRSTAHVAVGAAELYAIPATTPQTASAWELLYYLAVGEDYRATRLRWKTSGLLFGYAPLVADQALLASAAEWADPSILRQQLAQVSPPPAVGALWRDAWLSFAKIQSALFVRRDITAATFTQRLTREWTALRKGWSATPP